jgi:hypothetical protein
MAMNEAFLCVQSMHAWLDVTKGQHDPGTDL